MRDLWTGHRTGWVRFQFFIGVVNAFMMFINFDDGKLGWATLSAYGVYVTAKWALPEPTKPKGRK
jgi:hypothetical protein